MSPKIQPHLDFPDYKLHLPHHIFVTAKVTSSSAMAETARARRFQESAGKWRD